MDKIYLIISKMLKIILSKLYSVTAILSRCTTGFNQAPSKHFIYLNIGNVLNFQSFWHNFEYYSVILYTQSYTSILATFLIFNLSDIISSITQSFWDDTLALLARQRTWDSQVVGSSPGWAPLLTGLKQATYTCVPLSPSSIIWYQPREWSLWLGK